MLLPVYFPLVARQFLLSLEPEAAARSWTGERIDLLVGSAVCRQVSLGAEHRLAVTAGVVGQRDKPRLGICVRLGGSGLLLARSLGGLSIMDGEVFPHVAPDSESLPADRAHVGPGAVMNPAVDVEVSGLGEALVTCIASEGLNFQMLTHVVDGVAGLGK